MEGNYGENDSKKDSLGLRSIYVRKRERLCGRETIKEKGLEHSDDKNKHEAEDKEVERKKRADIKFKADDNDK